MILRFMFVVNLVIFYLDLRSDIVKIFFQLKKTCARRNEVIVMVQCRDLLRTLLSVLANERN